MLLWSYFTLLTLFWGLSFIAIRLCLDAIPPFACAGLRIFLGGLILGCVALYRKKKLTASRSLILRFIGIGVLNFGVAWACLFWGEQFVNPGVASIINSTVPLFIAVFVWFLIKSERPIFSDWVGALLGFVGILVIFVPSIKGFGVNPTEFYGLGAVVMMAVSYGLSNVLIRKWAGQVGMEWSFVLQSIGASLTLALLSLCCESSSWITHIVDAPKSMFGLFYLAVFSTALAWLMFYELIMKWGSLKASAVTYCMPFVSIIVDWLYMGHKPGANHMIGALLILSALGLLTLSKLKPKWLQTLQNTKLAA